VINGNHRIDCGDLLINDWIMRAPWRGEAGILRASRCARVDAARQSFESFII